MTELLQAAHKRHISSMAGQMSKWVDQVMGPVYRQYRCGESWTPAINLSEDDKRYCVIVDLAGLSAKNIEIHVEEGKLTISGYRGTPEIPDSAGECRMHTMEIDHGPFSRRLDLPDGVDEGDIQASYRYGYLFIRIPKRI